MSHKSRAKLPSPFGCFNISPDVIRLVVMMYVKYPLSLRNVEDLLAERGIDICHETVRFWWNRFGPIDLLPVFRPISRSRSIRIGGNGVLNPLRLAASTTGLGLTHWSDNPLRRNRGFEPVNGSFPLLALRHTVQFAEHPGDLG